MKGEDAGRGVQWLAEALLLELDRIAARSVARMHELLPSYARVPPEDLLPVVTTNTRNLLEAIRGPDRARSHERAAYRRSADTRALQGITSDEMLNAWRIGLESVREEAHTVAGRLGLGTDVLLEFIEATLEWGDIGMRESASAHHEAEIRELGRLVQEQAALRRVATLVACGAPPADVFTSVCDEVRRVIGSSAGIVRYESEGWPHVLVASSLLPTETRLELDGSMPSPAVRNPIVVDGHLWGAMVVTSSDEPLPFGVEERVARFTELVGVAIANADAREQLERLADEQAALRRVATMIAAELAPDELLARVAEEVGVLLGLDTTAIWRYDEDHATAVGGWGLPTGTLQAGLRCSLADDGVVERVHRTGRPARVDTYETASPTVRERARALGWSAGVACPVAVNGRLWGAIAGATTTGRPLPADAESRITQFSELVATAIANIEARAEVAASRVRIEAAADDERRRLVRDLHDGAQAGLVHTIVTLNLARSTLARYGSEAAELLDEPLAHARKATDAVRALARGILPSVLTRVGLSAAVTELAGTMSVPVDIDVDVDRLPGPVEATAYFIAAEALTNVVKHAQASRAAVTARLDGEALRLEVRDDGVGGADSDGHGLVGLSDRLAALGGRLRVESPADGGTLITATIPVARTAIAPTSPASVRAR